MRDVIGYEDVCGDCKISLSHLNLTTRLNEYKRATKKGDLNNNYAEDHLKSSHIIDWDSATCLAYSTDYYQRITPESWFTNLKQTALNRCQPLPAPYSRGNSNTRCTRPHSQSHHAFTNGYSIH